MQILLHVLLLHIVRHILDVHMMLRARVDAICRRDHIVRTTRSSPEAARLWALVIRWCIDIILVGYILLEHVLLLVYLGCFCAIL